MVSKLPTTIPSISGEQFHQRLVANLPPGWAGDDALQVGLWGDLLKSIGGELSYLVTQLQYVARATRLTTETYPELDLASQDFFGNLLPRPAGMIDSDYASLIISNLFKTAATRQSIYDALLRLTGTPPRMMEPWNIFDTGWWNGKTYWNVDTGDNPGRWGSPGSQYQGFIETLPASIPAIGPNNPILCWGDSAYWNVPGYFFGIIAAGVGQDVYSVVDSLKAEGTTVWVKLVNTPPNVIPPGTIAPSAPTGLVVTPASSSSLNVTWTASQIGTKPITYTPQYRVTGTGAFTNAPSTTATSSVITGLSPSTSYDVQIAAGNPAGTATSTQVSATTQTQAAGAPSVPRSVTLTPGTTTIGVAWLAPVSGTPPFTYTVLYRVTGNTPFLTGPITNNVTNATITGLAVNTNYDVEVVASNNFGSATSSVVHTTTAVVPPNAPTGLILNPFDFSDITVTWTASTVGTPPISYSVQYRVTGTITWQNGPTAAASPATITSLVADTQYDVQVVASNTAGSATSVTATTTTPLQPPSPATNLQATLVQATAVTLSWNPPDSGTPPFTYVVQYRVLGTQPWSQFSVGAGATSVTVINLQPSTTYQFEVVTSN